MRCRPGVLAVLAVVAAFALLYVVRTDRALGPAPVGTPAGATATASPTATPTSGTSPSPTTPPADRYGYVSTIEERILVRRERDAATVFELAGVGPAISADGRRLAYWRTTPNVGPTELRVIEVADPRTDRSVFALTGQTLGGGAVWSNDGQGLLVGIASRETSGGGGVESGNPARYDLLMLDLAARPPRSLPAARQLSGGAVYLPVAWDRPGQLAAAVVTGPGGFATEYVTWNGNAASPFATARVPWCCGRIVAGSVRASPDAKLILATDIGENVLHVWPILDITRADEVRHPLRIESAFWRPGSTSPYEVIWTVGFRIDLFRYQTDESTTLHTSTTNVGIVAIRPDGSAVFLREASGPPPPTNRWIVVDIATRQATEVAAGGVDFVPRFNFVPRGVLLR